MVLATAQACATTLIPLQKEELARLKDQPEIHAIHYTRPDPTDTSGGSGRPITPMWQLGPRGGAVSILAQLVLMGLVAAVQSAPGSSQAVVPVIRQMLKFRHSLSCSSVSFSDSYAWSSNCSFLFRQVT